jgi:hypothetical protein
MCYPLMKGRLGNLKVKCGIPVGPDMASPSFISVVRVYRNSIVHMKRIQKFLDTYTHKKCRVAGTSFVEKPEHTRTPIQDGAPAR